MKEKKVTGFDYLWCALYTCAAFLLEFLLVMIENKLGIDINHSTDMQMIVHWLITIALWVISGFIIIKIAKRTTGFDLFQGGEKLKGWQYVAIIACFIINIVAKYLDWDGFKVLIEWKSRGPLLFTFQYLYYFAESFLISLVIVFGQLACEKWFKNDKIPYGGIILGLTWGLGHIVSKGSVGVGVLSALGGFLFGTAYLFVNKDYRKTLPIVTLLFIL